LCSDFSVATVKERTSATEIYEQWFEFAEMPKMYLDRKTGALAGIRFVLTVPG
jgi:hypothetical protein